MATEYLVNGKPATKEQYDRQMKLINSESPDSDMKPPSASNDTSGGLITADDPEGQVFIPDNPQKTTPDSPSIKNKTNKSSNQKKSADASYTAQSKQVVVQTGEQNVLNSYRSVTYNFAIAGLKKDEIGNPDQYIESSKNLVILRSGGKGPNAMSSTTALGAGFNKNSPGRFDMYIEDVNIETLMAFDQRSNASLPTKITFEVIEPYSVNGFIEALHVASIEAGYTNYLSASFLLSMEFIGYPDNAIFPDPEIIPNSTRYFPFGITGIDVDITEQGTRYKVSAVPYNERAFGQPNTLVKPIKMAGLSVKEILTNLIENVNNQIKRSDEEGKAVKTGHDEYAIKFVNWSDGEGWIDAPNNDNEISTSKLIDIYRDNTLFKLIDPGNSTKPDAYKADSKAQPKPQQQAKEPEKVKYIPNKTVIQFSENMNIHDIIVSVIRDSEYVRNILKDIGNKVDEYGMVEYFMVRIDVTNLGTHDDLSKKPHQKYTYVVSPYRLHYTKIPGFGSSQIEEAKLKQLSLREYNYLYTGQNNDVINFKLNFNTLYFEAVPASMGNKDIPSSKTGTGPTNDPAAKAKGVSKERQVANQVPLNPVKVNPVPVQYTGANAAQPLDDPYSVMARNMHESIINSKASLLTGTLEILGDPLYLATSGQGNYLGKPGLQGRLKTGEANHLRGEILIRINFRNPIDIMDLENGGTAYFDPNRIPFSGIYRVTKAVSSFKNGVFKQTLEVLRVPGQILEQNVLPTQPSQVFVNKPTFDDAVIPDSTRGGPSRRLDTATAINQLNRGFPSTGRPGVLSNFTNAAGGLGGTDPASLNRVYGAVSRAGALLSGSSPIGQVLPTDIASDIRLTTAGIGNLSQTNLDSASLVAIASNVLTGNLPTKRAIGVIAGGVAGDIVTGLLNKANSGSGIGQGASVLLNNNVADPNDITAQEILSGQAIDDTKLPDGSINANTFSLENLKDSAVDAVSNIASGVGKFANDTVNSIKKLTAADVDPNGIAASVGINTSALSGLSKFQSKALSQISDIANSAPKNVDLKQAADTGLILQSIPADKMKNIPASQPFDVAPPPIVDKEYVLQVASSGGKTALENLYGVTDISKISSNIVSAPVIAEAAASVPGVALNPFEASQVVGNTIDSNVIKDKFATIKSQLSGLVSGSNILDKNIAGSVGSKFGSNSISSPLDKLVNNLGDPSAPPYTGDDPIIRSRLGLPPK